MTRQHWALGAVLGLVLGVGTGLVVLDLAASDGAEPGPTSRVGPLDDASCGSTVADLAARLGVDGTPAIVVDRCEVQGQDASLTLERSTWVTGGAYPDSTLEARRAFALTCAALARNGRRVDQPVPGTADPGTCASEDPTGSGLKEYVVTTRAEHVVVVRWVTAVPPDGATRTELRDVLEQIAADL